MIRKEVTIINSLGLHARPAAAIVKLAAGAKAKFWLEKDGQKINGKSIMGVMLLAAEKGSTIILHADGEDEEKLIRDLVELIQNKFYEE
jgi:phosphocarrier protein HPr